jgi:DNA-binding IclR family transcriptional regulator
MPSVTSTEPASQTLSRGIRILEVLADATSPLSIAEIAAAIGVHRSIAYRLLTTLEHHRLVTRGTDGSVELGTGLAALARSVRHDLQSAALPELTALADELGMTAFVAVLEGDEAVTLISVEPRHAQAAVAHRPGTRHPIEAGAPGVAIQTLLPERERVRHAADGARATTARELGYATSHDEVIRGLSSVAVALSIVGQPSAALAVVYVGGDYTVDAIGARLATAAQAIRRELR